MSSTSIDNFTPCEISEMPFFFEMGLSLKKNIFMMGNPGVGKTAIVRQFLADYAKKHKLTGNQTPKLITKVMSAMDRLDFMMQVANPETQLMEEYATSWVAELSNEHNPDGPMTVLYLNEYNICSVPALKAVMLRLLGEREMGELTLRDNVLIVADGNRPMRGTSAVDMDLPEKRRIITINVVADREKWLGWAMDNGIHPYVTAFLQMPNHFQYFDNFSDLQRGDAAWANPASWEKQSDSLPMVLKQASKTIRNVNTEGWVGRKAGTAFCAWLDLESQIPSVDLFLANPEEFEFEKMKGDVQWFLISHCGMLAVDSFQKDKKDKDAINSVVSLANWLQDHGFMEMGLFLTRFMISREVGIRQIIVKNPKFQEMTKRAANNPGLLKVINLLLAA